MIITAEDAIHQLNSGQVVALPTETVYGLAASVKHPDAIAKIYSLKGRPSNNPLILHLADSDQLHDYVDAIPPGSDSLMKQFWPGPLSIVLSAHNIPKEATGGLTTAAFRVPSLEITRQIIRSTGPLVMPSANLSGKPSGTSPQDLFEDFGNMLPVVDGGKRPGGIESTVVHYVEGAWSIIRRGATTEEQLTGVLGYRPKFIPSTKQQPTCPGQLYRHYAPKALLHLRDHFTDEVGVILGLSDRIYPSTLSVIPLGPSDTPRIVAENLYSCLRECDRRALKEVWVDFDLPQGGLWETIRERIKKAAEHE